MAVACLDTDPGDMTSSNSSTSSSSSCTVQHWMSRCPRAVLAGACLFESLDYLYGWPLAETAGGAAFAAPALVTSGSGLLAPQQHTVSYEKKVCRIDSTSSYSWLSANSYTPIHRHICVRCRFVCCRFIKNNLLVELTSSKYSAVFAWVLKRHTLMSYSLYMAGAWDTSSYVDEIDKRATSCVQGPLCAA